MALTAEFRDFVSAGRLFSMSVSILSVNVLTVLFINLTILLKGCFSRINKCLCELIQCAGEESVGLYRQISTVKHPQLLIEVNYNSDRPKSRIQHVRRSCDFLCDFIDHLNSVYSGHTLLLVTFYVVIFIYDSYYSFIGIMDVNRGHFGSVMWVSVTSTETFLNAVGFTVLIYFCSSTTCEVRLLYIFSF